MFNTLLGEVFTYTPLLVVYLPILSSNRLFVGRSGEIGVEPMTHRGADSPRAGGCKASRLVQFPLLPLHGSFHNHDLARNNYNPALALAASGPVTEAQIQPKLSQLI